MNRCAEQGEHIARIVASALEEDHAASDATSSAVVPANARATARIVARESGVLAGCAYAEEALRQCDQELTLSWARGDGDQVVPGEEVMVCEGNAAFGSELVMGHVDAGDGLVHLHSGQV